MESYLVLSKEDKAILDSYCHMIDGLGNYLGSNYEIVLHSLENLEHSAIKVINGHFSNRSEGAPITDLALKMLSQLEANPEKKAHPYFNKNKNGSTLKSSTIPVIGENSRIIGLMCINLYLERPLINYLQDLLPMPTDSHMSQDFIDSENFSDNIDDLILSALEKTQAAVASDQNITHINKNKEIVIRLYDQGIFNLKDSVLQIANKLGISKNTIYMHIRNHKKEEE